MTNERMTLEEFLRWLADVIQTETQKPAHEIDADLVEECEALLAELSGNEKYYSSEDCRRIVSKIVGRKDNN